MPNYFIAFDLPGTDEISQMLARRAIMETFPLRNFQYLSNGWFIQTDWPPEEIRLWMLEVIRPAMEGIVIRVNDPIFGKPANRADLPEWLWLSIKNDGDFTLGGASEVSQLA